MGMFDYLENTSGNIKCCNCGKKIIEQGLIDTQGHYYCSDECFKATWPKCAVCGKPMKQWMEAPNGKKYCSEECYSETWPKCAACGKPMKQWIESKDGKKYCSEECVDQVLPRCEVCGKKIKQWIESKEGKKYCSEECFRMTWDKCLCCGKPMRSWIEIEGEGKYCSEECISKTRSKSSVYQSEEHNNINFKQETKKEKEQKEKNQVQKSMKKSRDIFNMEDEKSMSDLKNKVEEFCKEKKEKKPLIVNAGMVKAGKSTLFNALTGETHFESGPVRTTIENELLEKETYVLVDTPGLDACESDDQEAFAAYKDADVIVFVHNLIDGEFNQIEIDAIKSIEAIYGDREILFNNIILVLTCKDQQDNYEHIKGLIDAQCKDVFGCNFANEFCVDSVSYLKGKSENKKLLIEQSGINELILEIESCVKDESDLHATYLKREKEKLISEIEGEKEKLESKKVVVNNKDYEKLNSLLDEVQKQSNNIVNKVKKREVQISRDNDYRWMVRGTDYEEYSSEYSAKSAGKALIEKNIREVAKRVKTDAQDIISQYEKYLDPLGVPTSVREELATGFDDIRKKVEENNIRITSNINFVLKNIEVPEDVKYARSKARGIDSGNFGSAEYYANAYSSNLYVDYDYQTKWVEGLFGGKSKEVKVYKFDADGAVQDVADEGRDIIREIINSISGPIKTSFDEIKQDLINQFQEAILSLQNDIKSNIQKIQEESNQAESINKKIDSNISNLNQLINMLNASTSR